VGLAGSVVNNKVSEVSRRGSERQADSMRVVLVANKDLAASKKGLVVPADSMRAALAAVPEIRDTTAVVVLTGAEVDTEVDQVGEVVKEAGRVRNRNTMTIDTRRQVFSSLFSW